MTHSDATCRHETVTYKRIADPESVNWGKGTWSCAACNCEFSPITLYAKPAERDKEDRLEPCGCGAGPECLHTCWYDADSENDSSELRVYICCDSCGSCGPEVETLSDHSLSLGSAEREACFAWNKTRKVSPEAAGKVPEVKALVDHLQSLLALQQNAIWDYAELGALIKPLLPSSGTAVVADPANW